MSPLPESHSYAVRFSQQLEAIQDQVRSLLQASETAKKGSLSSVRSHLNQVSIALEQLHFMQAELRQLEENEERIRQLIESSQQVFWMVSVQAQEMLYISPACEAIWGYPRQVFYQQSRFDWLNMVHPDDRIRVSAVMEKQSLGQATEIVYRIIRPDGRQRWIRDRTSPVLNAAGEVYRIAGIAEDISDRKQQEDRLLLLESVVVNANDAVLITEAESPEEGGQKIVYVNAAFCQMTGYSANAVEGKTLAILQGEKTDRLKLKAVHHAVKSWQPCLVELIHYRQDGSEFWAELSFVPVEDRYGWFTHWVVIQRDISERKQAQQELERQSQRQTQLLTALQESEARFRAMADSAPVLLWIDNPDDQVTFFNQAWLRFTGRTLEQEMGTGWMNSLHPADLPGYLRLVMAAIRNRETYQLEYRLRRFDGEYRWMLEIGTPNILTDGSFGGYIGSCIDISDRRQAELEIYAALEKEKELRELKSRFITAASHEFRTPLSTILSSADLLEYYVGQWSAEKQVEHYGRIQTAALGMCDLLNDVLVMESAEAKTLKFEPAPFELIGFCQQLIDEFLMSDRQQHPILFHTNLLCLENSLVPLMPHTCLDEADRDGADQEAIIVCLDERLLRQMLNNLLSNALKYSPDNTPIHLTLSCDGDEAIFEVKDEGIGIPAEDQPRLFEPFHRAQNVGNIPGTGLGLSIVKQLVGIHGGQVMITSAIDVGTTVKLTLPMRRGDAEKS